jgi:hypothetical protein
MTLKKHLSGIYKGVGSRKEKDGDKRGREICHCTNLSYILIS